MFLIFSAVSGSDGIEGTLSCMPYLSGSKISCTKTVLLIPFIFYSSLLILLVGVNRCHQYLQKLNCNLLYTYILGILIVAPGLLRLRHTLISYIQGWLGNYIQSWRIVYFLTIVSTTFCVQNEWVYYSELIVEQLFVFHCETIMSTSVKYGKYSACLSLLLHYRTTKPGSIIWLSLFFPVFYQYFSVRMLHIDYMYINVIK